ncbi:PepSY-associated TM helix domain-containing protein [Azospirillum sp. ST 5-10]|uniref:PepSY-associated TM helix domain-containing protein n=1 Tax=unclassified Azospirillum TaxID=2630922 RepID=UPI003F4A2792
MTGNRRRALFRLHAWIGLHLGWLLFVVCFSGTVAVFGPELNRLADPSLRVDPPSSGGRPPPSWQRLHDAVAAAHPHAAVLALAAADGPRSAALAAVAYGPEDVRRVPVDPATGRVQGQRSNFGVAAFLRIFHKQLYIVPSVMGVHGTLLVGALALPLLAGAVAGWLSLARWRRALTTLRVGRSPRLLWSDLHRLAGLWALPVTALLCLTGLWYLAETALDGTGALPAGPRPLRLEAAALRDRPAVLAPIDLDRAAAIAAAALPGLEVTRIALPVRPGDPLTLTGQAAAWLVRDRANQVRLDPYSGAVLDVRRGEDLGLAERWVETADPLHFGTFAGLPGRLLWFAAGLALCAGILAGLGGAWLRLRAAGGTAFRPLAALAAALPAAVVVVAAVAGTWAYGGGALRMAQAPAALVPLGQGSLGPWTVAAERRFAPAAPPGTVDVALRIGVGGGGTANAAGVAVWTGEGGPPDGEGPAVRRLVDRVWARVADCGPGCRLHVRMEDWAGRSHRLSLPLHAPAVSLVPLPPAGGLAAGEVAVVTLFLLGLAVPLAGWLWLLAGPPGRGDAVTPRCVRSRPDRRAPPPPCAAG